MDTPATLLTYDAHLRQLTVFVPEHKKRRYPAESSANTPFPGPVYRLPNEMLASVLEYLSLRDALSASTVCQWWRDVSLATPLLWTCVRISSPTPESDADAADYGDHALPARFSGVSALSLEHARSWLDRSKSLPITIYVELHASSRKKWSKKLAKLLSHYMPRVTALHIVGRGTWRVTKAVLSAILPHATKLTAFSVNCDTNGGDANFASIAALVGAPAALGRLQCLTIGRELRWRASDLETNRFTALQALELSIDDIPRNLLQDNLHRLRPSRSCRGPSSSCYGTRATALAERVIASDFPPFYPDENTSGRP
ncbi:hypothetical protein EXIGLDRAFT_764011 [Exidia glandulosa HHB12029]|uniref:F-box domain-containing protein n=1 Tax=Exidia glandulosa HHB12029 TaxID=1314781 RepID=A0A165LKG6_EXIGL|nr:hypothetical protein EXIGLDRAFT_764011 [Exidia glandulosa HHB12029]